MLLQMTDARGERKRAREQCRTQLRVDPNFQERKLSGEEIEFGKPAGEADMNICAARNLVCIHGLTSYLHRRRKATLFRRFCRPARGKQEGVQGGDGRGVIRGGATGEGGEKDVWEGETAEGKLRGNRGEKGVGRRGVGWGGRRLGRNGEASLNVEEEED